MNRPRMTIKLTSRSPEETQQLGRYLGEMAQAGDVFLLVGELGSGKTCLVQGIASGLDVREHVFSPSFVLIREYQGRLPLYHVDFYRLDHIDEIADLGLDDYIYGAGVCVIEWADKGTPILPDENLTVVLKHVSETERTVVMKASGERYVNLLKNLSSDLKAESRYG